MNPKNRVQKNIIFDIGQKGEIKGKLFVKQLSDEDFSAMIIFEYPKDIDWRLKELLDCAQSPQKGRTQKEAETRARKATEELLKRPLEYFEQFQEGDL